MTNTVWIGQVYTEDDVPGDGYCVAGVSKEAVERAILETENQSIDEFNRDQTVPVEPFTSYQEILETGDYIVYIVELPICPGTP